MSVFPVFDCIVVPSCDKDTHEAAWQERWLKRSSHRLGPVTHKMQSFIAVRKEPRTSSTLSRNSVAKKRAFIEADAATSRRAALLGEIGLQQVDPPGAAIEREQRLASFARLGYVGAYVVNARSNAQASDAVAILEKSYHIVPNVDLQLPPPVRTTIRGPKKGGHSWPAAAGVAAAHREGITGQDVRILVLDTGCDADHTQFDGKHVHFRYISPSDPRRKRDVRGFDPDGHGTHVCGILAGRDVGVAPDAELYVASVVESESVSTSLERILIGLDWLLSEVVKPESNGEAAILNMSLGFRHGQLREAEHEILVRALRSALQTLLEDFSVLPIVAAGNDSEGNLRLPGYFPEVVSVGAVDWDGNLADFTSRGAIEVDGTKRLVPDVWGYGVEVYSALERNSENRSRYALKSGTSMAAPYVAGIAALHAQATGAQGKKLKEILKRTALGDPKLARFVDASKGVSG